MHKSAALYEGAKENFATNALKETIILSTNAQYYCILCKEIILHCGNMLKL